MTRIVPWFALLVAPLVAQAGEGLKVPVALARMADGRLAVALRDGRAVALVDVDGGIVTEEWALPFRPASVAASDRGRFLLVGGIDGEAATIRDGQLIRRFEPGRGPTTVYDLGDGRAALASRWDETVRVVSLADGRTLATH